MSVISSARTVSLATLASRILGLVRDMLSARILGRSFQNSAFILAFMVPNLFRRLFGEGALASSFIPVYVDRLENDDQPGADKLASRAATLLTLVLTSLSALGIGASLAAVSFLQIGLEWGLTFRLLAILLPYVILICLVALYMSILNSHGHFFTSALAPIVLNVFWIGGLLGGWWFFRDDPTSVVYLLAFTLLAGGGAQALMHVPALRKRKIRVRPDFNFRDKHLKKAGRNFLPMVLGLAALQVNVFLDQIIARAAIADEGAVATLFYSNRMVQFPLALIGIALGTALLPALSRDAARGDGEGFQKKLVEATRLAAYLGTAAMAGLIVLAEPVIGVFFQGGRFEPGDTARTGTTLVFYAMAVLPYCMQVVLARAFYARQDTKTPVRLSLITMGVNLGLNLALVWSLEEKGIALATAASSTIYVLMLLYVLEKKYELKVISAVANTVARAFLVSLLMAAACVALLWLLPGEPTSENTLTRIYHLLGPMAAGGAVFIGATALAAKEEGGLLMQTLKRG